MTLRIGIIGAGKNTKLRHIPGFQRIDGVEVVAVCNRSTNSAKKLQTLFTSHVSLRDPATLFMKDIDAVCIGTWPYMHKQLTIASLEAGKHVLTEARMAMSLAEAREMLLASEATDKVSMVVPAPCES